MVYPPQNPCCDKIGMCSIDPFDYTGHLASIADLSVAMGVLVIVGSFVAILPQMLKVLFKRSVHGLSFHTLLIGNLNQVAQTANLIMSSFSKIQACFETITCMRDLTSMCQVLVIFAMQFICICEYIYFEGLELGKNKMKNKEYRHHLVMFGFIICFICFMVPTVVIPGIWFGSCDPIYQMFGFVYGCISSGCACFEWIPQIVITYKSKSPGAVSLIAIGIMVPGSAISTLVLVFTDNPWYTWVTWICSLTLQIILLVLIVYYTIQERKMIKKGENKFSQKHKEYPSDQSNVLAGDDKNEVIQQESQKD